MATLTLGDIYQAVKALDRQLAQGAVIVDQDAPVRETAAWPAEDPGAAAALDALANL